jgi:Pel9A-like, right handed beta helix region
MTVVGALITLFAAGIAPAGDIYCYYVAPDGSDANPGSFESPFGTFNHAIAVAAPGDTICVRGGTYRLDHRLLIDNAGTPDKPIHLWAVPGETPILDFSGNPLPPPQPRDGDEGAVNAAVGIHVGTGGHWWHLRGLTIQNAPYYGVRIYGSHNTFEQLTLRYNKASGLEITGKEGASPSYNLVLNCDSYLNFDPQSSGEDADGFAAKFDTLGPGNVFRGLRAWSNADDGFDFWHAKPGVLVEDCWSFDNGFNRPQWAAQVKGSWRGDGLGFKLGQAAGPIILNRVVAWGNKAYGIDDNGNGDPNGIIIRNATLVNNAKDGNPVQISLDDGMPHSVANTIAFDIDGTGVTSFKGPVQDTCNTWNGIGVSAADFETLDKDTLFAAGTAPRNPDGTLPAIGLRLTAGSHLIDAGLDVGLPYRGTAPDLGAFEFSLKADPTSAPGVSPPAPTTAVQR